jgi:hypothetical protein
MKDEDTPSFPTPATLRDTACGPEARQRRHLAFGKLWRTNDPSRKSRFMEVP